MIQFKQHDNPTIFLFGAGGTGGFFLENVARLLAGEQISSTIHVYDGDTVEPKNLKRQAFTPDDIDANKANAITNRLSKEVYNGPEFIVHDHYMTSTDDLLVDVLETGSEDVIFVLAVDNIETRQQLNETISDLKDAGVNVTAIDCGNNAESGQVVVYANYDVFDKPLIGKETPFLTKSMLELYPELNVINNDSDRNPGLVTNCAENAESKPQAMMANKRNADVMANIIIGLVRGTSFTGNVWESDLLTFSTTTKVR